jgi:hypothetical protein
MYLIRESVAFQVIKNVARYEGIGRPLYTAMFVREKEKKIPINFLYTLRLSSVWTLKAMLEKYCRMFNDELTS